MHSDGVSAIFVVDTHAIEHFSTKNYQIIIFILIDFTVLYRICSGNTFHDERESCKSSEFGAVATLCAANTSEHEQ